MTTEGLTPPPLVSQSSPMPPRRRFRLYWWTFIPLLMAISATLWAQHTRWTAATGYSYTAGSIVGLIILSMLVAWVAGLCSRRHPMVISITFTIVCLLLGMGQLRVATEHIQNKNAAANLSETARQINSDAHKSMQAGTVVDARAHLDRLQSAATNAADASTGESAASMRALATLTQSISANLLPYQNAIRQFNEAGGIDIGPTLTLEKVDHRLDLLASAQEAFATYIDFYRHMPDVFRNALSSEGVDESRLDAAVSAFRAGGHYDENLKATEIEGKLLDLYQARLQFLRVHWDSLTLPEEEGGAAAVADPGDIDWFNENIDAIQAAAAEQDAIKARIRDRRAGQTDADSVNTSTRR